jgi:hypothetical protein
MTYRISGTARQVGAIGVMEPFTTTVSDVVTEEEARDFARNELYDSGWEHVLIMKAEPLTENTDQ